MDSLNPWIKGWFLEYYKKNIQENIAINEYKYCKPKKVQLIEFRKVLSTQTPTGDNTNADESWWAIASDKDVRIPCYFTRKALNTFESTSDELRFTQLGGSIVFLLEWKAEIGKIDSITTLSDGTNGTRRKPSLYFVVNKFAFKGCVGEPVFGDPTDIMSEQLISDFTLNQLRSGSSSVSAGALSRKSSILGRRTSKIAASISYRLSSSLTRLKPLSRHATLDEADERRPSVHKSMSPGAYREETSGAAAEVILAVQEKPESNPRLTRHPDIRLFKHSQWPVWMSLDEEICWMTEDEEFLLSKAKVFNPIFVKDISKALPVNQMGYEGYFSSQSITQSNDNSHEHEKQAVEVNFKEKEKEKGKGNEEPSEKFNYDAQSQPDEPSVLSQVNPLFKPHPQSQYNQAQQYSYQYPGKQLLSTDRLDSSIPLLNESHTSYDNIASKPQSIEMRQQNSMEEVNSVESSSRRAADIEMRIDEDSSGQSHNTKPAYVDNSNKNMDIQMADSASVNGEEAENSRTGRKEANLGSSSSCKESVGSPKKSVKSQILRPAPLLLKTGLSKTPNKASRRIDVVNEQLRRFNNSTNTAKNADIDGRAEGVKVAENYNEAESPKRRHEFSPATLVNDRPSTSFQSTRPLLEVHQQHELKVTPQVSPKEIQGKSLDEPSEGLQQPSLQSQSPHLQPPQLRSQAMDSARVAPYSSPAFEEENSDMQIRKPGRGVRMQRKRKGSGISGESRRSKGKQLVDSLADLEREEDLNYNSNSDEVVSTPSSKIQFVSSSGELIFNTPPVKVINASEASSVLPHEVAPSSRSVRRRIESNDNLHTNEFAFSHMPSFGSIGSSLPIQGVNDVLFKSITEFQRKEHLQMLRSQKSQQLHLQSQSHPQLIDSQVSFHLSQTQLPNISSSNDEVGKDGTFFKGTQEVADVTRVLDSQDALIDSQQLDHLLAVSRKSQQQSQQSQQTSQDRPQVDTSNSNNSLMPYPQTQQHAESQSQSITISQLNQQTKEIMDDVYDNSQRDSMEYMKSPPAGQQGQHRLRDVYVNPIPAFRCNHKELSAIKSMRKR